MTDTLFGDIVSYSEVFKFDTCMRQYYYRFVLGLSPEEESAALTTGVKGHKLLQAFYEALKEGKSKEEAHNLTKVRAMQLIREQNVAESGTLLKAWTLVDNYIQTTEFTSSTVLVENRFLLPATRLITPEMQEFYDVELLENVQIGFTPDVVFQRNGNHLDVEDAKFVGRAWSKSKLNRFQQAKLYQIFLNRMGYNVTRTTVRFFNVQTGEIKEQNYSLKTAEEYNLIDDFLLAVTEVIKYRRNLVTSRIPRRTMDYTACQYCPFELPCSLEAEGKDASKTLKYLYVKSNYGYNS